MKILLADNLPSMRSAIKLLLSQIKEINSIIEVKRGNDLLKKIKKEWPSVVLLDWDFLGKKTKNTVISLKASCPNISVVILSTNPEVKNEYFKAGADDFIMKGDPPEKLYDSLVNLISKKNKNKKDNKQY